MTIGRTSAVALVGLEGLIVDIEADVASGLPRFAVVGLPDRSLSEATDRVRSAIVNSGLQMSNQRVTVNLSPAGLPKTGTGFDLAIAMSALAATAQVPVESVAGAIHIGELALDGRLRPTVGVLPAVLGAARAGARIVIVPAANQIEAGLVPDVKIIGLSSLREVAIWHGANLSPVEVQPIVSDSAVDESETTTDLSDVVGNAEAIEALITAAAGGHHLSMLGPPGAGKTMLAVRLAGILPDLSTSQALDVACVRSLSGAHSVAALPVRPPFEAPHHTATTTALVGGGSSVIRPGAIARAVHGVLFLDEAPEFAPTALDSLRQPLENGEISIHRATVTARFPARFLLVLASNPCPCGKYGLKDMECTCPPAARRRYFARLSGPLRDRVDINVTVDRLTRMRAGSAHEPVTTALARHRVTNARARALERWAGFGYQTNAEVPGVVLRGPRFSLPTDVTLNLDRALARNSISARGYDRVLRLAWTLSDLDETTTPTLDHVGRALLLRRGA